MWQGLYYIVHEPGRDNPFNYKFIKPSTPNAQSPKNANGFAFSRYSNQVAYIKPNQSKQMELWVGNLDLDPVELAWVDDNHWLGELGIASGVLARIIWGPDDHSLILFSYDQPTHLTVVDLNSKNPKIGMGTVTRSPGPPHLTNGRFGVPSEDHSSYLVVEAGGAFKVSTTPPKDAISVKDWAFSPDDKRVLYADSNDRLAVILEDGKRLTLDLAYQNTPQLTSGATLTPLKWSLDGSLLFLYAQDMGRGLCTKNIKEPTLLQNRECWLLLNSSTGKWVWSETDEISRTLKENRENLYNSFDAALSPDGKWVVMFFVDKFVDAARYGIITSIETGETQELFDELFEAVYWSE